MSPLYDLPDLYALTSTDWDFQMSGTLTEPTCFIVTLTPVDGSKFKPLDGFIGTHDANETIALAVAHVIEMQGIAP